MYEFGYGGFFIRQCVKNGDGRGLIVAVDSFGVIDGCAWFGGLL